MSVLNAVKEYSLRPGCLNGDNMKIHMEYADCTVTEEHDEIRIFGNDNVNPIVVIKNGEIFVYGMDEHYHKSPSEDFKHLKVFLLDA